MLAENACTKATESTAWTRNLSGPVSILHLTDRLSTCNPESLSWKRSPRCSSACRGSIVFRSRLQGWIGWLTRWQPKDMDYFIGRIGGSWWSGQNARSFGSFRSFGLGLSIWIGFMDWRKKFIIRLELKCLLRLHTSSWVLWKETWSHAAAWGWTWNFLARLWCLQSSNHFNDWLSWRGMLRFGMLKCGELGFVVSFQPRLNKAT